jgi:Icc-related predicted phosphoesterase
MALKVASDIHGEFETLVAQLDPSDTLLLGGDYVEFVDYETLDGILSELVPKERIAHTLGLIRAGRMDEAKAAIAEIFVGDPRLRDGVARRVRREYGRLFAMLPCETYLIYGNIDHPRLLREFLGPRHHLVEAGTVAVDGLAVGMVSGMPPTPYTFGLPGDVAEEEYGRRLDALGPVDLLVTHAPPAIRDLTFDVVADRDEKGSPALLRYIDRHPPRWHYFGHVHQPIAGEMRRGATDLRNVSFHVRGRKVWVHPPGAPE